MIDRLTWLTQLASAIRVQLGAGDSPADDPQITALAAAISAWLESAVGDDCVALLSCDDRLLTAGALEAQLIYDPASLTPVQTNSTTEIIRDLLEQLRCEYRRKVVLT